MGYIREWLSTQNTSPSTGLPLNHRRVLRVSSLTGLVAAFLQECRDRREQTLKQRVRAARRTDRTSHDNLQQTLRELEAFADNARSELLTWERHLGDLQDVIVDLRVDAARCSRTQDRVLS